METNLLLCLYDIKTEQYSDLICTTEEAFDQFAQTIVNSHTESAHHLHAEDFVIYRYGTFQDGKVTLDDVREIHGTLGGYKKPCKYCKQLSDTQSKFRRGE